MLQYLDPVPFTVDNDAHLGLSETQGLLSCDGRNLVIEYRIADTVIGLVKTSSKELAIPLASIRSIKCRKRFFGFVCSIVIATMSQQVLDELLGSMQGRIELKIRRRDRARAEDFCLEVGQSVLRLRTETIAGELE
jgi:hypothetical protein